MTKEWPPDVYGGAGVHVVNLVEHLRPLADVTVQCFGSTRSDAQAFNVPANLASANPALATLGVDLLMADNAQNFDVVHSHTWYANLAGHLAGLLHATRDPHNGYRYFSPADVKRVQFIRQSQDLGLKIADIKTIFDSVEQGHAPCTKVEILVRQRLDLRAPRQHSKQRVDAHAAERGKVLRDGFLRSTCSARAQVLRDLPR